MRFMIIVKGDERVEAGGMPGADARSRCDRFLSWMISSPAKASSASAACMSKKPGPDRIEDRLWPQQTC